MQGYTSYVVPGATSVGRITEVRRRVVAESFSGAAAGVRGLPYVVRSMSDLTSSPQASHPGARSLAKSSILGRSPINSKMRSRTSAGFLLFRWTGLMITCLTDLDSLLGLLLVARRHISALLRVQKPMP